MKPLASHPSHTLQTPAYTNADLKHFHLLTIAWFPPYSSVFVANLPYPQGIRELILAPDPVRFLFAEVAPVAAAALALSTLLDSWMYGAEVRATLPSRNTARS